MRKDKYRPEEKRLCNSQEQLIINHTNKCHICKTSFKEYKTFGVSYTPPCKDFEKQLRNHVNGCGFCSGAQKKWNEDAISITPEMRQITGDLAKGKLPDVSLMKKVSNYLFKELNMSSDEIHDMSAKAENEVRKSLEEEK